MHNHKIRLLPVRPLLVSGGTGTNLCIAIAAKPGLSAWRRMPPRSKSSHVVLRPLLGQPFMGAAQAPVLTPPSTGAVGATLNFCRGTSTFDFH